MYKLCFFVPNDDLDAVKRALFKTGAGKIGNYDQCCWQSKGEGQFRPLPGSKPHTGALQKVTTIEEWKVELVCESDFIRAAVKALKLAHPYEEVAYEVTRIEPI